MAKLLRAGSALAVPLLLTAVSLEAHAQLAVVPPILNPAAKKWERTINVAVAAELDRAKISLTPLRSDTSEELQACGNSLGCMSSIADAAGASHVLHTVVGQKGKTIKAQITLVNTKSQEPEDRARFSVAANKKKLAAAVGGAVRKLVGRIATLEVSGNVAAASPPEPEPPAPVAEAPANEPAPPPEPAPTEPEPAAAGTTEVAVVETQPMAPAVEASPVTTPPIQLVTTPKEEGSSLLVWLTTGTGVAAVAAGSVFLFLAKRDADDRDQTPQIDPQRVDLNDSAFFKQGLGISLLAAGGAAIATGVYLGIAGD